MAGFMFVAAPSASACTYVETPEQCVLGDPDQITEPLVMLSIPGELAVSTASVDETPSLTLTSLPAQTALVSADTGALVGPVEAGPVEAGWVQSTDTTDEPVAVTTGETAVASGTSRYPCIRASKNRYNYALKPVTSFASNSKYQYRWQFSPYVQYYARTVSGKYQWQFELCAVGGADGQNGYRTMYNASIMAAKSTDAGSRRGLAADSQNDDGAASSSLNMQFSAGPVTISGSIPTNTRGNLYGQYGKPKYPSSADAWASTESFAGWKAAQSWWRPSGSPDMESQVHHGLFEFDHGDWNKTFPIDAQFDLYCSHPYGVGC